MFDSVEDVINHYRGAVKHDTGENVLLRSGKSGKGEGKVNTTISEHLPKELRKNGKKGRLPS